MTGWLVRIGLFVLFLFPIVVDQYSVNYLFAAFAGVILLLQFKRLQVPSKPLLIAMTVYLVIYLVSVSLDILDGGDMALRRTVSFAIFMSIFVFSVVDLGEADIKAFKIALITLSFVFAMHALVMFFLVGGNGYGFDLKNVVGSQRYGFVYLLALFVLIHLPHQGRWGATAKVVAGYVIMAGVLLTFSRASVISLAVVLPLYVLAPFVFKSGWSVKGVQTVGRRAGVGFAFAAALFLVMPVTFDFYRELILDRYSSAAQTALVSKTETPPPGSDIFIPEGSEGTRLSIWRAVIDHTIDHPLIGSGYLGSWTLDAVVTGSAHNQYFDVLMRTGLPGIAIYVLMLAMLFLFLWRRDQGLFWGGLAVLVYGFFHETFKESQGAFILGFLIGMYATYQRSVDRPAGPIEMAD